MDIKNTFISLAEASSTSGQEYSTAPLACKLLEEYMPAEIDALGSVFGTVEGEGDGILLEAHLDSIGMVVTGIEENGFLRIDKCGGVDLRTLGAHDVTVHGKKDIYGVVTSIPPHLLTSDEKNAPGFDEIMIDTGIMGKGIFDIVSLGDRVTFKTPYREMLNNIISGAYADNKAGVCAVLRCLEILKENNCNKKLCVLFATQEETGGSGAACASFKSDCKKCIAVDVSFAKTADTPKTITAEIGKGTLIGVAPNLNYEMSEELKAIAKEKNIPYSLEIMSDSTGTDADHITVSAEGKKTALLSIPIKNMHTAVETVSVDDIEYTAQLMAQYVLSNGGVKA